MRFRGLLTLLAVASAQGASLDDVLARMDSAAKQFKSYSATANVTHYSKMFDDRDEQIGPFRLRRIKNGVSGIYGFVRGAGPEGLPLQRPGASDLLPQGRRNSGHQGA